MKFIYILCFFLLFNLNELKAQFYLTVGNQGQTKGHSITYDKDSNYVVIGSFQGKLNFNPWGEVKEIESNLGSMDIFIAKYDRSGQLLWVKNIGTNSIDVPTDVEADKFGNIFISGYFGSENVPGRFIDLDPSSKEDRHYGEGGIDAFFVKLNSSGDYQWGFLLTNIDGNSTDIIWDIGLSSSGQIYLAGTMAGTIDFNPLGNRDRISCPGNSNGYFLAKYDKTGRNIWTNMIGANIINPLNYGFCSIDVDGGDGCVISGNFRNTAEFIPDTDSQFEVESEGETDIFIARYSSSGKITFRDGFGGKSKEYVFPKTAEIGKDGKFNIVGKFSGTCDFYPGFGEVMLTNKDSEADIFLSSYSLSGSLNWVIGLDCEGGEDIPKSIEYDNYGNIIISGIFRGNTNFDPDGAKLVNSKSSGVSADAFMAKYDNGGHFIWVDQFGDELSGDYLGIPKMTTINDMVVDNENNSIVIGDFFGDLDLAPSEDTLLVSATKVSDFFISKYDFDGYLWYEGGGRPALRIISPNGGEVWNIDSTRTVTWYSKNVENVKLEYSINDGENWLSIADSISATSSSFSWKVENNPSELCKMKITNIDDPGLFDVSNGKFTITSEIQPSRVVIQWSNPSSVVAEGVVTDSNNNIYVAGNFQGTINIDQGIGLNNLSAKGSNDIVIAKYSELGELYWGFNIGEIGSECTVNSIGIDGKENIYIAGKIGSPAGEVVWVDFSKTNSLDTVRTIGGLDGFIAKYNSDGEFIWAFVIGNTEQGTNETINEIDIESNGTILATGTFNGSTDFDGNLKKELIVSTKDDSPENFFAKYNTDAKPLKVTALKTNFIDEETEGISSIESDGLGGFYIAGNFRDSVNFDPSSSIPRFYKSLGKNDIFLAHYKITGKLDWLTQLEGIGNNIVGRNCFKKIGSNIILSGSFENSVDFQPGLLNTKLNSERDNPDIFIASYRSTGDLNWVKQIQSKKGFDFTTVINSDSSSNIILSGFFSEDISFESLENSNSFTSQTRGSGTDIFLSKFDYNGNYLWGKTIGVDSSGSSLTSYSTDLAVDRKNNIIMTGAFHGNNVNFDADSTQYLLSSQGREDGIIVKFFDDSKLWIQAVDSASLYLIRPNGDEKFQAGNQEKITWSSEYVETVSLYFSLDNGTSWNEFGKNISANLKEYLWLVPDTVSTECLIKITDPNNPRRVDISARNFEITDKKLRITYPNGGEAFKGKRKTMVSWFSDKVNYLNIYFSSDGGENWNPISISKKAEDLFLDWKIRNIESSNCLMKIVDKQDTSLFDISDAPFTIIKSNDSISLIFPNGGEILPNNMEHDISFYSIDVDSVSIDILNQETSDMFSIIKSFKIQNEVSSFQWFIEDSFPISNNYRILVSSLSDSAISDLSDSTFSVDIDDYINEYSNKRCFKDIKIVNPFKESILIFSEDIDLLQCDLDIFNLDATRIFKYYPNNSNKIEINFSQFGQGVYFLKISNTKCTNIYKLIKMK